MSKYYIIKKLGEYVSVKKIRAFFAFWEHYIVGLWKGIDDHHLFLFGAGIAFSMILSIIPFLVLSFSILVHFTNLSSVSFQINKMIDTAIPYQQAANYVKNFLHSRMTEVLQYKTISAYVGSFALFFTSTWLFSSIRTVLNKIFGVTKEKTVWIALLRDFGMVLLLIFFILLSTFAMPILNFIINLSSKIEKLSFLQVSELNSIIITIVSMLLIFSIFYVFYFLIPYEKLGKKVPIVGAFWATILWELARVLFGYYVRNFLSVSKVYGAFVLIVVIIFWLFYSSMIFIIGAEIAQLYRVRKINRQLVDRNK